MSKGNSEIGPQARNHVAAAVRPGLPDAELYSPGRGVSQASVLANSPPGLNDVAQINPGLTAAATCSRASGPVLAGAFAITILSILIFGTDTAAQSFEVGVQFTGVHLHKIDEGPFGIGGRLHYNLNRFVSVDTELTHSPENGAGNFGETTALFGIRAGKRFDRVGFFTKGRTGLMHFGGDYFKSRLDKRTRSIVDIGGIVEYYPAKRAILRLDFGDTVIYYGAARLFNRPNPDALGTVHNVQSGLGLAFVF